MYITNIQLIIEIKLKIIVTIGNINSILLFIFLKIYYFLLILIIYK